MKKVKALLIPAISGFLPALVYSAQYGISPSAGLGAAGLLGGIIITLYAFYLPTEAFLYTRYVQGFNGGHGYYFYNSLMFAVPFLLVFFVWADFGGLTYAWVSFIWSLLWAYLRVAYKSVVKAIVKRKKSD